MSKRSVRLKSKHDAKFEAVDSNTANANDDSSKFRFVLKVPRGQENLLNNSTIINISETDDDIVQQVDELISSDDEKPLGRLKDGLQLEKSEDSECNSAAVNNLQSNAESEEEEIDDASNHSCDSPSILAPKQIRKRKRRRFRLSAFPRNKKKTYSNGENGNPTISIEQPPSATVIGLSNSISNVEDDDVESEISRPPTPPSPNLSRYSSWQLLLDFLLRVLYRKDSDRYFWWPVTDRLAPGYSDVVHSPMDFMTIRQKIEQNAYPCLKDMQSDAELICSNAQLYNSSDTIYHLASRRMQAIIKQLFSEEKLKILLPSFSFSKSLRAEQLGFEPVPKQSVQPTQTINIGNYDCIVDSMTADELVAQVQAAAALAKDRLAKRRPNGKVALADQKKDGTVTLKFLTPRCDLANSTKSTTFANDSGEQEKSVTLGSLVGKLKQGNPGLSLFHEDKRNTVTPVQWLDYGCYSSFAPQYDSTWATLNKEDSQLLLSTYGGELGVQYAKSLMAFAPETEFTIKYVDGILDAITNGQHSRTQKLKQGKNSSCVLPNTENEIIESRKSPLNPSADNITSSIDWTGLKSLSSAGIDISFLNTLEPNSNSAGGISGQLQQTGVLLSDLAISQQKRLSQPPPFTLIQQPGFGHQELSLAGQVLDNLSSMVAQTVPGALADVSYVQNLMGVQPLTIDTSLSMISRSQPSCGSDVDMDLLSEFLQVDHLKRIKNGNNDAALSTPTPSTTTIL